MNLNARKIPTLLLTLALILSFSPASSASSSHTFTSGGFSVVVSTATPFTMGTGGMLSGQRMLLDNTSNQVTFSISASDNRDLSGATCSFDANSDTPTSTINGQTMGSLVTAASSASVDCTFTSLGLTGGYFVIRVGGQASAEILYYLNGGVGGSGSSGSSSQPAPAKYSGPEFSGLSAKGIMTGSSSRLEGKNLDEINSIEIGGKAATFKLDGDKALDLTLPEGLAPGTYDLVINSSAGKLTHINAIRVREPLKSFSITSRSVGRISEEQYQEHALISAMQIPELNKARCVVNASSLAMAKAQAQRLCALVKAANPNIETTIVEARSTVKSDSVFARVSYGWSN